MYIHTLRHRKEFLTSKLHASIAYTYCQLNKTLIPILTTSKYLNTSTHFYSNDNNKYEACYEDTRCKKKKISCVMAKTSH